MTGEVILQAEELVKHYPIKAGVLRRTVGHARPWTESPSSSTRRDSGNRRGVRLRQIHPCPHADAAGGADPEKLIFDGVDVYSQKGSAIRRLRRDIQIVFQDPYTSLNPRKTVGDIIGEPFEIHTDILTKRDRRQRVQQLLELVGLNPEHINRYPISSPTVNGNGSASRVAWR